MKIEKKTKSYHVIIDVSRTNLDFDLKLHKHTVALTLSLLDTVNYEIDFDPIFGKEILISFWKFRIIGTWISNDLISLMQELSFLI